MGRKGYVIASYVSLSTVDVLGHTSSVIFLPFCNLKCYWCQNKDLVKGNVLRFLTEEELKVLLSENSLLCEYIQVSGGEPTLHEKTLREIFTIARDLGLKTSLNTNGTRPWVIKELINSGLLDHVAMDVKAPLDNVDLYIRVTSGNVEDVFNVKESLEALFKSHIDVEIRTTLIPDLEPRDVIRIGNAIKELSDRLNKENYVYVLQYYNGDNQRYCHEDIMVLAKKLMERGVHTAVRTPVLSTFLNPSRPR